MYFPLSLTEFKNSDSVKTKKKGAKGYKVMRVGKHKTGSNKNAVVTMSPEEYKLIHCYVDHYRVLLPKRDCAKDNCPLFPASLQMKEKPDGCCEKFCIGNVSKVIIFLSRIDTLVKIVKLLSF